jgi:hypothetical protein
MNSTKQIDAAMKRLEDDPQLARDFDELRRTEYPGKTRREAAALGLAALEARRDAALAKVRATAMSYTATVAAKTFKKAVAAVASITKPRADKRQGALPMDQWSFGHLATAAQAGDKAAQAELAARGYSQTSNNTYSKLPA